MSFTSLTFLVFLGVLVVLYYLVPRKFQWVLLLLASYAFYLWGGGKTVVYLLITTCTTYLAGRLLGALNSRLKALPAEERKARKPAFDRKKKQVVLAACLLNFGLLYILKYWSFTAEVINNASGLHLPAPDLLMPLGVSFFTFQSIGYVIDCYRGKYAPQENLGRYALFVSFFPQIIQGPIARYDQLGPQLLGEHRLDWDQLKHGIQLCMWGYFKKLVIAERIGVMVNAVFSDVWGYSGSIMAAAVLGYSIQLYCDFSGGIDITRGVGQMLGIEMAENFRRPLFALSLTEYWRRWHITLGAWMRDYVFYPIALSKGFRKLGSFARKHFGGVMGKIFATSMATFVVYFVIGIWHGANFRYIAYGFYNGGLITAGLLLEPTFVKLRERIPIRWDGKAWHFFQMARTSLIVFVGRYMTRAPRLLTALAMIRATVTDFQLQSLTDGTLLSFGLTAFDYWVVALGMVVVTAVEWYQEKGGHVRKWMEGRSTVVQWAMVMIPLLVIVLLGAVGQGYVAAEFIYAQF